MARVVDGVGARAVVNCVDVVVSRLEVFIVCMPSQRSVEVGGRW